MFSAERERLTRALCERSSTEVLYFLSRMARFGYRSFTSSYSWSQWCRWAHQPGQPGEKDVAAEVIRYYYSSKGIVDAQLYP